MLESQDTSLSRPRWDYAPDDPEPYRIWESKGMTHEEYQEMYYAQPHIQEDWAPALFPEHGEGVPALYSDPELPSEDWDPRVEEIITLAPLPIDPELNNGEPGGAALSGGAGVALLILAAVLLFSRR